MEKRKNIALFIMLLFTFSVSAQIVPPSIPPPPPPGLPIDGGILLLLLCGAAYGIKQTKK